MADQFRIDGQLRTIGDKQCSNKLSIVATNLPAVVGICAQRFGITEKLTSHREDNRKSISV